MNVPQASISGLGCDEALECGHRRLHLVLRALMTGCTLKTGAALAGVEPARLDQWRKRDADVAAQIALARRRGEARLVRKIWATGDWRAMAWMLERGFGGRWAAVKPARQAAQAKGESSDRGYDDETRRRILECLGGDPSRPDGQPAVASGGAG